MDGNLETNTARLEKQRDPWIVTLRERISTLIPHGSGDSRLTSIFNFSVSRTEGEALVLALDAAGARVSAGSACEANRVEPSHVLRAMGIREELAQRAGRVSIAADAGDDEIGLALEAAPATIRRFPNRTLNGGSSEKHIRHL